MIIESKIIYSKSRTFVIHVKDSGNDGNINEYIIKMGGIRNEVQSYFETKINHINIAKVVDYDDDDTIYNEILKSNLTTRNENWLKLFQDPNYLYDKRCLVFEKNYSDIFKHPNNVSINGVKEITGFEYVDCLSIKLSFLFQILQVSKYLHLKKNICHSDMTFRNVWFKDTSDEIIDYGEYKLSSYGFLLQLGDFGETKIISGKCNDLLFVVKNLVNDSIHYFNKCNNTLLFDISVFDDFLLTYDEIYKLSETAISEENYSILLNHEIFTLVLN